MAEVSDQQLLSEVSSRSQKVQGLIASSKLSDAVAASLENPPLASKDPNVKTENATVVLRALCACSDADIAASIKSLSDDQCDTLMKYIYRGLSTGQNSAVLFKWHAQLVERAGLGCIVRAMADRQTA